MAQLHVLMGPDTVRARPTVRRIGLADLKDALARGLADFSAIPTHAVFLCLIYPIVGLVLARAILGYALLPLLFPLAAGFALVGPFAAIGFYELSRRREQGLDISWEDAFDVLHSRSRDAIAALGFLLLVIFAIWIVAALLVIGSLPSWCRCSAIRPGTSIASWWSRTSLLAKTTHVRRSNAVMRRNFPPRFSPARTSSLRDSRSDGVNSLGYGVTSQAGS